MRALSAADCPEKAEPSMRYVIAVCLATGFLIWDGVSNEGRYLDAAVGEFWHLSVLLRV
jgi:hypothetical protein